MKKILLLLPVAIILLASCTKKTTNNYYSPGTPSFLVMGLTDVNLTNYSRTPFKIPLEISYLDSSQEKITLTLSALPDGVAMDSSAPTSGFPTYYTTFTFYDSSVIGATPGTYPVTLTATTSSGRSRSYTFSIIIHAANICSSLITGTYDNCMVYNTSFNFSATIYQDSVLLNKVWLTNYAASGNTVYGYFSCVTDSIIIPQQYVNKYFYSGRGIAMSDHYLEIQNTSGYGNSIIIMK